MAELVIVSPTVLMQWDRYELWKGGPGAPVYPAKPGETLELDLTGSISMI
jgi:hypothetical protein